MTASQAAARLRAGLNHVG